MDHKTIIKRQKSFLNIIEEQLKLINIFNRYNITQKDRENIREIIYNIDREVLK